MRYAVFSDVHSNLEAFEAVLDVFKKSNIDAYLFIGDIVGYGANPRECIKLLQDIGGVVSVAGNHDWACAEVIDAAYFNEAAQCSLQWTQERVSKADKAFLSEMELLKELKGTTLVHGTLSRPKEFDYMIDAYRAQKSFYLLKNEICFVGHSHRAGVFIEEGQKISYQEPQLLKMEAGKRYIVNDGSVGQPRDSDARACFCIYDEEARTIEFKRVVYNIASAQTRIIDAGLPSRLAERLARGV